MVNSDHTDGRGSFEDTYAEVRGILEASTHYMTRLTLDSQYPVIGKSSKSAPAAFAGPLYSSNDDVKGPENSVVSFSHCSYSWFQIPEFLDILRERGEGAFEDPAMYTILPAAKTVEMHWRRVFLDPNDFKTRHFSIPRVMKLLRRDIKELRTTNWCYDSGISPFPRVCAAGPVWESFWKNIATSSGHGNLGKVLESTEKIFYVSHEYRHCTVSPWEEIEPIYKKIATHMGSFLDSLSSLLSPDWDADYVRG